MELIGDNGFLFAGNELPAWIALRFGIPVDEVIIALEDYFSGGVDTVAIQPMPTPRPRATSFNGSARVYHPSDYAYYKAAVANEILLMPELKQRHYFGLATICYLPFPESEAKIRTYEGRPHDKKPDFDNMIKGFVDAMVDAKLLVDDGKLHTGLVLKRYTTEKKGRISFKLFSYPDK